MSAKNRSDQKTTTLPLTGNHNSTASLPVKNKSDRKTTPPLTGNNLTTVMLQPKPEQPRRKTDPSSPTHKRWEKEQHLEDPNQHKKRRENATKEERKK
jgi:hypothetical protein